MQSKSDIAATNSKTRQQKAQEKQVQVYAKGIREIISVESSESEAANQQTSVVNNIFKQANPPFDPQLRAKEITKATQTEVLLGQKRKASMKNDHLELQVQPLCQFYMATSRNRPFEFINALSSETIAVVRDIVNGNESDDDIQAKDIPQERQEVPFQHEQDFETLISELLQEKQEVKKYCKAIKDVLSKAQLDKKQTSVIQCMLARIAWDSSMIEKDDEAQVPKHEIDRVIEEIKAERK